MQKRDIFGRRKIEGIPPFLSHVILWSGVALLVWGETYSAMRSISIDSGSQEVVTANPALPDPDNDGHILHLTGNLRAATPAADPRFGAIPGGPAAFLRRTVEMRQWKKLSPRNASRTAREGFDLTWSKDEIDTRADDAPPDFMNPPMPIRTEGFLAQGLQLEAYAIDEVTLTAVDKMSPVKPSRELASQMETALPGYKAYLTGDWIVLSRTEPEVSRYRRTDDRVWPAGALRVKFEFVPIGPFTVVGSQFGNRIRPYEPPNGAAVLIARTGNHPASALFRSAAQSNTLFRWAIRIFGAGIFFAGLHNLMRARDRIRRYGADYYDTDD